METISKTYSVDTTAKVFMLRKDIALINVVAAYDGKELFNKYQFVHPDKITDTLDVLNIESDNNYQRIGVMKKGFLEAYSKTGFNLKEYETLNKDYEYDSKTLFKSLEEGIIAPEDLEIVEVSFSDEKYYPFIYGKTREGWLPHMEPFNHLCYMLTDHEYDLKKVEKYILEKEKEGLIVAKKTPHGMIQEIPYYNHDEDSGDFFINFYCYIDDKEKLPGPMFADIPYVKKEIEKFKI